MITTDVSPSPCWYLSHVGVMEDRLPLASGLHPVLVALGRKYPYWLVAAAAGDILRPAGGLRQKTPAVSLAAVESVAAHFRLKTTGFDFLGQAGVEAFQEDLTRSIAESRPGLAWWPQEHEGWWYPVIGHDSGCRHVFIRTWGQRFHEYEALELEVVRRVGARLCLFEPVSPPPPEALLARLALEQCVQVAREYEHEGAAGATSFDGWSQALEALSDDEAADPDVAREVGLGFLGILNSKRGALEFCVRATRWLRQEANHIERARSSFARVVTLLQPAAADFGGCESAAAMLRRPEKRQALARTYRAAGRMETRAIREFEAALAVSSEPWD